jgi:transitional endoplasmic reticulum ATPase
MTKALPVWAESLRQKYLAGEAAMFILHGNVFDDQFHDGMMRSLMGFLSDVLFRENKQEIVQVDLSGVKLRNHGTASIDTAFAGKTVGESLQMLESRMGMSTKSTAMMFPYAETLFPSASVSMLSTEERLLVTTLHRWSLSDVLLKKDNVVVLITENIGDLNPALVASPKVAAIRVPLPDLEDRREWLQDHFAKNPQAGLGADVVDILAAHMAGLRRVQMSAILATPASSSLTEDKRYELILKLLEGQEMAESRARQMAAITAGMSETDIQKMVNPGKELTGKQSALDEVLRVLFLRKREAIEKECAGLIEFVDSSVGLDAVGGMEGVKEELMSIAKVLKSGEKHRAPMGILAVGPMGAGKTFVIRAFLKEAGLPGVMLKNFRSKWVGSTESNLETVLQTVKAMGPCAVIIDESDRSMGGTGDSDGGTSSRVIARLKEFMSDTDNRGDVLFILMTNRPDKLDIDLKRPGRLDRKIPFFYPETPADKEAILRAVAKRSKVVLDVQFSDVDWNRTDGYSAADLETMLALANEDALRNGKTVTTDVLHAAMAEFLPPQDRDTIELMELLAVLESSRRSMLPERFRDLNPEDLKKQIRQLSTLHARA